MKILGMHYGDIWLPEAADDVNEDHKHKGEQGKPLKCLVNVKHLHDTLNYLILNLCEPHNPAHLRNLHELLEFSDAGESRYPVHAIPSPICRNLKDQVEGHD
jgi:hypothetical protein